MTKDIFFSTVEIEIRMLCQVDDGRLVGYCTVFESECIIIAEKILYLCLQISGISFLSVRTQIPKQNAHAFFIFNFFRIPHHTPKSLHPAMQMMWSLIGGQRIFLTVY